MEKFRSLLEINPNVYNIALLDEAWELFNKGASLDPGFFAELSNLLVTLRKHPDAWTLAPKILAESKSFSTQLQAFTSISGAVNQRWLSFTIEQKEGLQNFLIEYMLTTSSTYPFPFDQKTSSLLQATNISIISILRYEWPNGWSSFIPDLMESGMKTPGSCFNILLFLKELTNEIFENPSSLLTKNRRAEMKRGLAKDFSKISLFFDHLFSQEFAPPFDSIVEKLLETLTEFIAWMPINAIFQENGYLPRLVSLIYRGCFIKNCLLCLIEIARIELDPLKTNPAYIQSYLMNFMTLIAYTNSIAVCNHNKYDFIDISAQEESLNNQNRNVYGLSPSNFSNGQENMNEVSCEGGVLKRNHNYVLNMPQSQINIDFWVDFKDELTQLLTIILMSDAIQKKVETPNFQATIVNGLHNMLDHPNKASDSTIQTIFSYFSSFFKQMLHQKQACFNSDNRYVNIDSRKRQFYGNALFRRIVEFITETMIEPVEMIIVTEASVCPTGPKRVKLGKHESLVLFNNQKEVLRSIGRIEPTNIIECFSTALDADDVSIERMNKLSWSLSCLNEILPAKEEYELVRKAIKVLLNTVFNLEHRNEKAILAGDIMIISRKMLRHLRESEHYTEVLIYKNLEFFNEDFKGVQDMAVETFHEICSNIPGVILSLVVNSANNLFNERNRFGGMRIIELLIRLKTKMLTILSPHNKRTFVEALALVVAAEENYQRRSLYIKMLVQESLDFWRIIVTAINDKEVNLEENLNTTKNHDFFRRISQNTRGLKGVSVSDEFIYTQIENGEETVAKKLSGILVTFSPVFEKLGLEVRECIEVLFTDGFQGFKKVLVYLEGKIKNGQQLTIKDKDNKELILQFIDCANSFLSCCLDQSFENAKTILPNFLSTVTGSFLLPLLNSPNELRVPGVFKLSAYCCRVLGESENAYYVVSNSLRAGAEMVSSDFESFPAQREELYEFIDQAIKCSFKSFLGADGNEIMLSVNLLLWGCKHLDLEICKLSIRTLLAYNKRLVNSQQKEFYLNNCYFTLLIEIMSIVFVEDREDCKKEFLELLSQFINLVETGMVIVPLYSSPSEFPNNKIFICSKLLDLLQKAYSNVAEDYVKEFIMKMFSASGDREAFEEVIEDFVVVSKRANF